VRRNEQGNELEYRNSGILYAFQEQTQEDNVMLDGFGTICKALGRFVAAEDSSYASTHLLHSDARSPICLKSAVQFCGDSTTNLPKSDSRLLIWLVHFA